MSDLQPNGVLVTIAGEERKLLLSFSAIDHIQSAYPGESVFSVLKKMLIGPDSEKITCNLLSTLWSDAITRDYMLNPENGLGHIYTPDEIAYLVNLDNKTQVQNAILQACRISIPETGDDDEDDDPNMKGEADK